jgi:ABC-type multidrug transport system permease subunit
MNEPRGLERSALYQLSYTRMLAFLREPEAIFWVFAFPILLALALGIAFRNTGPARSTVVVADGRGAGAVARALSASPELAVEVMKPSEADAELRRGRAAVLVQPGDPPTLVFDPARPETRLARLMVDDALERAAGREDLVRAATDTRPRPGGRYIDFLIPGLLGLNLLGTGMWGIGFPVANARQLKLLKRMVATPMRRRDYLLSLMFARLVWLALEVGAIAAFGWIVFDVAIRGSWAGFLAVSVIGGFAFSALGLLVACRARTIEAVSGLMNFVMMPMWLLSGSFFSSERFPSFLQPVIQALPLTAANDAYRALMNEGAGLLAVMPELGILAAWTVASFWLALAWFRWE